MQGSKQGQMTRNSATKKAMDWAKDWACEISKVEQANFVIKSTVKA